MIRSFTATLLAATAMAALATPATAATHKHVTHKRTVTRTTVNHDAELRALIAQQQAKIDELSAKVSAMSTTPATAEPSAEEVAAREEAAANAEFLKAQVDSLQSQLTDVKAQTAANAPTWNGMPQWKGSGFSFKPSGELQYDAGYISNPNNKIATPNLGFNNRSRRLLFGAAGDLPGGFKYSFQFNLAQGTVDYEDLVLSYEPAGKPFSATVGYFYPFNGLDNLTSNRFVSVVERSQATDAFNDGRRLGIGFGYNQGDWRFSAGVFANSINGNTTTSATTVVTAVTGGPTPVTTTTTSIPSALAAQTFDNNDWALAGRILYAPVVGGNQLHFAVNGEYRRFKRNSLGARYRARPFTQITDQRFADAGTIAAKGDFVIGAEALGIFGPLHVQGEARYDKVDGYRPGSTVASGVLDPGEILSGSALASNPSFFSAYGEVGYWLTGETRGYKNGKIDRTKILNGFDKGGWGGFQLVGRVDYLDLKDNVGGANVGTQVINGVLNGGQQTGYMAALNWWPIDYVRFTAQFIHTEVKGGPLAGTVRPLSTDPIYDRKYHTDGAVVRAQIDF